MRLATLSLTALSLAAVAALGVALQPAPAPTATPTQPQPAAPEPVARTTPGQGPVRGAEYELRLEQHVDLAGQSGLRFKIQGHWGVEALASGRKAATLRDAQVVGLDEAVDLPASVRAELTDDGLSRLGLDTADPMARRVMTTVLSLAWLGQPRGAAWTRTEESRTARFTATFERNGRRVVRTRALDGVYRGGRLQAAPEGASVAGETHFLMAPDGLPERIVGQEVLHLPDATAGIDLRVESRFVLIRVHTLRGPKADGRLAVGAWRAAPGQGTSRRDRDVQLTRDVELGDVLADTADLDLARFEASKGTVLRRAAQLAALLRLDPSLARAVAQAARDSDSALTQGVLIHALAKAAHRQGSDALRGLLAEEDAPILRRQAAVALGVSDYADADGALAEVMAEGELAGVAEPAAGNLANTLRDSDPEAAAELVDPLLDALAQSDDRAETLRLLNAVANSGDARALPVIRECLAGSDPELAMRAAYALRFIPGAEADALLMGLLAATVNPLVRQSGLNAVAHRDPATWTPALSEALALPYLLPATKAQIQARLSQWS